MQTKEKSNSQKKKYKIKIFRKNRKIQPFPKKLYIIYMCSLGIIFFIGIFKLISEWNLYSTFIWVYIGIWALFILSLDIVSNREKSMPMIEESQKYNLKADEEIRNRLKENKYDINYIYTNSLFELIACKTNIFVARTISILTICMIVFYIGKLFIY